MCFPSMSDCVADLCGHSASMYCHFQVIVLVAGLCWAQILGEVCAISSASWQNFSANPCGFKDSGCPPVRDKRWDLQYSTGEFVHQQSVYMGFVWNVFGYILFPFCLVFRQDETCWNRRKLQVCGLNSGVLLGCFWWMSLERLVPWTVLKVDHFFNVHSRIWMPRTKSSERRWTASIAWCRTGLNCVAQTYSWDCQGLWLFCIICDTRNWIFMDVGFWDPLFDRFLCIVQGDFAISVTSVWIQLSAFGPSQSVQPFSIYPPDSTVIQQPHV